MNKTREITEAGIFAAILAVFMIGAFYIPILGGVMVILLPLPVLILTLRNRLLYVVVATFVSGLIASMFVTLISGMGFSVLALLVGIPLGLGIKNRWEGLVTILIGGLGALIAFLIVYQLIEAVTGLSLYATIEQSLIRSMEMQSGMLSGIETVGNQNVEDILMQSEALIEELLFLLGLLFPSIMLMSGVFYSMINFIFAPRVLKRLNMPYPVLKPFSAFTYPKHFAYGASAMLLLAWFVGYLGLTDPTLVQANFTYLFFIVFFIQALALIYGVLRLRFVKPISVVFTILLVFVIPMQLLSLVGFFDVLFNLRKLNLKKG